MPDKKKAKGQELPKSYNFAALPKIGNKMTLYVFTDPLCSDCWGDDPSLRRLELEYGDHFDTSYHMFGLWAKGSTIPAGIADAWDKQARNFGMPMSGKMWRENAPDSSHPSCMACKVAFMQGFIKGEQYTRLVREFALLDGRNIAEWDVLLEAAKVVGLDADKFKKDYDEQGAALLEADMKLVKEVGITCIPTIIIKNGDKAVAVEDVKDYHVYAEAFKQVAPGIERKPLPTEVADLFDRYLSLTARELDELTENLNTLEASSSINKLTTDRKAAKLTYPGGFLWRKVPRKH
ncbi:DsbA family protein [Desulfovibrio sp. OttesenSCG-928-F07]|nr:DsbA family protein [Desulfovibrio sp. OttesenSCG-928-F07]